MYVRNSLGGLIKSCVCLVYKLPRSHSSHVTYNLLLYKAKCKHFFFNDLTKQYKLLGQEKKTCLYAYNSYLNLNNAMHLYFQYWVKPWLVSLLAKRM